MIGNFSAGSAVFGVDGESGYGLRVPWQSEKYGFSSGQLEDAEKLSTVIVGGMANLLMKGWKSLRKGVHGRVIYPGILALRGETGMYRRLRELQDLQWSNAEDLRDRQRRRLFSVLRYAHQQVPFYRERWKLPSALGEEEVFRALKELPPLRKVDLQEASDRLTAEPRPSRVSRKTTGGSTGEPVTVLKDSEAIARERAATWLAYGWFGVEIGDRGARFWGSPSRMGMRRLRYAAADFAMNRIRFSAFAFSEEDLEHYWKRCLATRPDYFYGYVSMMTEFARYLRSEGRDGRQLELKAVIATSEALTDPQRELLVSVFGAPVQNEYGCGEVGPVAYECPEGSLHVMSENVLLEVIGEDGGAASPGESGEILVTDLNNRAMPLVRYRVGDRAVRGESCSCGRGFPVLGRVWGRSYDFVQASGGRRYHGEYFMYLFEDLREAGTNISKFRVTQQSENELEIELVAPDGVHVSDSEFLKGRLRKDMPGMDVKISIVDVLDRAPSGKTRVIRNRWLREDGQ